MNNELVVLTSPRTVVFALPQPADTPVALNLFIWSTHPTPDSNIRKYHRYQGLWIDSTHATLDSSWQWYLRYPDPPQKGNSSSYLDDGRKEQKYCQAI